MGQTYRAQVEDGHARLPSGDVAHFAIAVRARSSGRIRRRRGWIPSKGVVIGQVRRASSGRLDFEDWRPVPIRPITAGQRVRMAIKRANREAAQLPPGPA